MKPPLNTVNLKRIQLIARVANIATSIIKYAAIVLALATAVFIGLGIFKFDIDGIYFRCPWNNLNHNVLAEFASMIRWIFTSIVAFMLSGYLSQEIKEGSPFSFSGSNKLKKGGMLSVVFGGNSILLNLFADGELLVNWISSGQIFDIITICAKYCLTNVLIIMGLVLLFLSRICKYGAEVNEYLIDE